MKNSWIGCWFDLIKMKFLFWKEGLPIPRRKSCHCEEIFACPGCQRTLDFKKIKLEKGERNFVSWSCPHCRYVFKSLQCPSCGCFTPENVARMEGGWICTACLTKHYQKAG